jgi:hypothetical protein
MKYPPMTAEEHYAAMRDELAEEFRRRRQEGIDAMIKLYGGVEAYEAACRRQRAADPDHRLARIVLRLIRNRGLTNRFDIECLAADKPLAAYFASVAEAGDLAFMDERRRIRQVIRESTVDMRGERYPIFDVDAVWELLPIWREWGSALLLARRESDAAVS